MTQDRLNSLAIMSIENQVARQMNLQTVLKDFSEQKLRNMESISIVDIDFYLIKFSSIYSLKCMEFLWQKY